MCVCERVLIIVIKYPLRMIHLWYTWEGKKQPMEIRSTIAKTFQRFAIPRSKSSIGSFTIASSTGTTANMNDTSDELPSSSSQHSSSNHRHPPLSYNQHFRLPSNQQHPPTRTVIENSSSAMLRSSSTDFQTSTNDQAPRKSKVNISSRFISFSNIDSLWILHDFLFSWNTIAKQIVSLSLSRRYTNVVGLF